MNDEILYLLSSGPARPFADPPLPIWLRLAPALAFAGWIALVALAGA